MFTIPKALICAPLPGSLKHTADRKLEPYQIRLHYYQKRHRNTLLGFIPQSEHQSSKNLCIGFSLVVSQPSHPVFGLFPHCEIWSQANPRQRLYTCEKSRLSSTVFAARDVRRPEAYLQTACSFGARRSSLACMGLQKKKKKTKMK